MKTLTKTFILLGATICTAASAQNNKSEQDAIRKVIDAETRSFFQVKYDEWANAWAHDSTVFRMDLSTTGFSQTRGWDKLSEQYKQSMQNMQPYSEADIATWMHKFDYHYIINGNMAYVTLKEGLPEKNASDEFRIMIKQNGEWKIAGMAGIGTASYNLQNAMTNLKSFLGTWKMDTASFKTEPASTGMSNQLSTTNVHETDNGIEMVTHRFLKSNGDSYSITEQEQFVPDYNKNEIRYIDIVKYSQGYTYTQFGKVELSADGNIVVTIMDEDKPTIKRAEAEIALQKDGSAQLKNKWYDTDGKQQGSNSFTLQRL
jgi:hypothetical protein